MIEDLQNNRDRKQRAPGRDEADQGRAKELTVKNRTKKKAPQATIPVREAAAELIRGAGPLTLDRQRAWLNALCKGSGDRADKYVAGALQEELGVCLVRVLIDQNAALGFAADKKTPVVVCRDLERVLRSWGARRALQVPAAQPAAAAVAEV